MFQAQYDTRRRKKLEYRLLKRDWDLDIFMG